MEAKDILNLQLFNAAYEGRNDDIVQHVINGAEINSRQGSGYTPLYVAAASNHLDSVKLLSYLGADVESEADDGATALFNSAYNCHSSITEFLLSLGSKTEIFSEGHSPLYVAISSGCVEDVKMLLKAGALTHYDNRLLTPILLATQERDRSPEHHQIYKIIMEDYYQKLELLMPYISKIKSSESFKVVVVRYDEDLSWLNKEFKDEEIIILNKGKDDLSLEDLPVNSKIINIPNEGWFGGSILYYLANYYYDLNDITLFLQGEPYDQAVDFPLIRYKYGIVSECNNIRAKCSPTTLLEESNVFLHKTKEEWAESKYGGRFELFENYTMIDFAHQYIDKNITPEDRLPMVWGAQFAVLKEKIHIHKKAFYQRMLEMFGGTYPMADFYLEKLWNIIFQDLGAMEIDKQLFDAALRGDKQSVIDCLNKGADINSKHDIGATAIYAAVNKNKSETVKFLVEKKADIEIPVDNGATPLFSGAINCHHESIKILIDAGADIEKGVDGYTPLAAAISSMCKDNVEQLLDARAELLSDVVLSESDITSYHKVKIPFQLNSFLYNQEDKDDRIDKIYPIVLDHYHNAVADRIKEIDQKTMNDKRSFEVVVVRYKEDLSWVSKEFPHDKVTVYNKGPDDIGELSANIHIKNIENIGYLGGTYLKHIVDNYNSLADRTLFIQGDAYDVNTFFPLIRFKGDLESKCKNIIGKCVNTTLAKEWNFLKNLDWDNISRYKDFEPRDDSMLDYHYKYIGNHSLDEAMYVTYGAIFSVDKEVVLRHEIEHYAVMLPEFNYTKPMVDHFMEREWDPLFDWT